MGFRAAGVGFKASGSGVASAPVVIPWIQDISSISSILRGHGSWGT